MDKDIRKYFYESYVIVNDNFLLIIISCITSSITLIGKSGLLLTLQFVGILIISPLIHGRFYELTTSNNRLSYTQIFKNHWLNYSTVLIIIVFINFLLAYLLHGSVYGSTQIILDVLSIYIFPLVFIRRQSIASIVAGIDCLVNNYKYSRPLILITLVLSALNFIVKLFTSTTYQDKETAFPIVTFTYHIFTSYVEMILFITAVMILINKPDFKIYTRKSK